MQTAVKEREESEHAPEPHQLGPSKQPAQRRHRERDREKPQRPVAGGMRNELDWVRPQAPLEPSPCEQKSRGKAKNEDGELHPLIVKEPLPRHTQKFFRRSMPS